MNRFTTLFGIAISGTILASNALGADPLRVCVLRFTSSSSAYLALDKGYYADENLDVKLNFFDAAQPVAVAVSAGSCDVGITGFTAGMYNLAGKGALKIIAGEAWEEPRYQFIGYVASNTAYEAGLKSIKDLPGHRFGVTQLGSTFHYNVGMLAEKYGWQEKAVAVLPLQSVANMIASVKSGAVDATALPSFVATPLSKAGAVKLLGWVSDETPWQVSGVFASTALISKNREVLQRFVKAYTRATAEYDAAFNHLDANGAHIISKDAEALFPIIMKYTNTTEEQVRGGMPYVSPTGSFNVGNIAAQLKWYEKQGFVDSGITVDNVVDTSFVSVVKDNFK